ncbi:type IIL restriction-modification enzyme MmeI [Streptococcus dysgalactiae]
MDWRTVVNIENLDYIIGNPPFIGYSLQTKEQKEALKSVYMKENGKTYQSSGKIDFVSGWFYKASQIMHNTNIRTAFVSTNSICQGDQVSSVWKPLYDRFSIKIDFAYQTFKWESEASQKAGVYCVIIGFSSKIVIKSKILFSRDNANKVNQITPYLTEGKVTFIENRSNPISHVIPMTTGNRPADGGSLIIEADEYKEFIKKEPNAQKFIKKLTGGSEFINKKDRYCLWLVNASPSEIQSMPLVLKRIEECRQARLTGATDRKKLADTPHLFREQKNPDTYLAIPQVSSSSRRYIPIGFLNSEIIPTDLVRIIENATIYEFAILTSNVHMAWMRAVAGRLGDGYRYSNKIVYNNFPWPETNDNHKEKILKTGQAILDARMQYPESSLADLYDELTMPVELRKSHQENDKAVMEAYGMIKLIDGKKTWLTESETVAKLFEMYEELDKM